MGITGSVRAARLGTWLAWLAIAAWPLVSAAQAVAPPAKAKGARPPAATAPAGPTFTIERTPAWVRPVAHDATAPMPAAPYQILVADEQIRVQEGGSTHYWHTLRQINDTSGLQQGGQIELDFDPSYQRLVFHKIEIVRGGQRIDKLDARKIRLLQREQQLERQVIDGRVSASLVLDDLRAGDRVEWSASVIGDNPVFGGRFVAAVWDAFPNAPIGTWQLRLLAPAARDIRSRVGDSGVTSTSVVHDGLRETLFTHGNVAQLQVDDHVPPAQYLKIQVELSEFNDWKDVAAWAAKLFANAMQTSPAVEAQVAALKAQAPDRDALLRATLDFVQRDIRYFGTESGIDSHQPATADTVLRQRFGDCKDKVALLAELLTRLGFEATPVLVSAHYQGAARLRLPGPLAFDHAIVQVMLDGKPVFLDATRSQQTGRIATRESLDLGVGLLAQDATVGLTTLPGSRDLVRIETVDTFSFPKLAQEGTLTSVTTLHGDAAEWFRIGFASQPRGDIEKAVGSEAARAYPSLVATGPVEFETITEDNTVKVTSHYRTGDFWTLPQERLLVGHFALAGLVAPLRLPDQATRTQPYRMATGRYLQHVVFDFGEPSPGTPRNSHFDESNDIFELHTRLEAQASRQEMFGELHLVGDLIPAADWPAHRDKVNKAMAQLAGGVSVSPFSVAQFDAFRGEADVLLTKLRKGDVKTTTPVQANAHMVLLAYDRELDSDRLPPTLRAQVLQAKGAQLDNLGQLQPARKAFESSLALNPNNADTHAALAINALFLGEDDIALKEAAESLRLAPAKTAPYFIRGYAHFFKGDPTGARDDFLAALQSREEVERGYGAIWLYLSTRRAGATAADAALAVKPYEPTGTYPAWPFGVLQLMEGRIDMKAALAASQENGQRNLGRECELYFFAGEKAAADGDLAATRKFLRLSVATGVTEFVEYQAAQRELARIGDR